MTTTETVSLLEHQLKIKDEALKSAISAGEYVVSLCEATVRAGESPNPYEKADWAATCAHVYAAMAFLNQARLALDS